MCGARKKCLLANGSCLFLADWLCVGTHAGRSGGDQKRGVNAAADMGVRRLVFTSTYGAVHMNPNRSPNTVLDETCWSDYEFCKQTGV